MTELAEQLVPDLLNVIVPAGARVVVMSDLHFGQNADQSSEIVAADLARLVDSLDGPGVVVLGGDVFELLIENHNDPGRALRSHPRLASALRHFAAGEERRVIVLLGTHDWPLAWHAPAVRTLQQEIGAELALVVDLVIATGCGVSKVRVEHGHQFDPANAFDDPRNPGESPLAHHVVRELLPLLRKAGRRMARRPQPARRSRGVGGLRRLPHDLPATGPVDRSSSCPVPGERRARPRLGHLRCRLPQPVAHGLARRPGFGAWAIAAGRCWRRSGGGGPCSGPWAPFGPSTPTRGAGRNNDAPRRMARRLVGEGYVGYITGHTHQPELVDLGDGFYANTGGGGSVVERRRGRFGFPPAFAISRRLSWVEIEAGAGLHARLLFARQPLPTTTILERLCTAPVEVGGPQPSIVGNWPDGHSWPEGSSATSPGARYVRRIGAVSLPPPG